MQHTPVASRQNFPHLTIIVGGIALMAIIATLAGLFWPGGDGNFTVTSYRGQEVEIYGRGVYRDSSAFNGAGARGTDLVTLVVAVPLLLASLGKHLQGRVHGTILLAGALVWIVYVYSSMALGTTAYNDLFLLYVALFGAGLWTLVSLFYTLPPGARSAFQNPGLPHHASGTFLIAAGAVTAGIWLLEPLDGLLSGEYPELLGVSTTLYTHGFDLAVITPAAIVSGLLIRRGHAAGYLAGVPLMMLIAMLSPAIAAQTAFQMETGIEFAPVQLIVMIGGFMAIGIIAIRILAGIFTKLAGPDG